MKNLLKLEELFLLGLALFLFSQLDYGWGWYALLFLAPDLSMVGYLANPRVGSWTYNLIHHKGLAVALYVLGSLFPASGAWLMFGAVIFVIATHVMGWQLFRRHRIPLAIFALVMFSLSVAD